MSARDERKGSGALVPSAWAPCGRQRSCLRPDDDATGLAGFFAPAVERVLPHHGANDKQRAQAGGSPGGMYGGIDDEQEEDTMKMQNTSKTSPAPLAPSVQRPAKNAKAPWVAALAIAGALLIPASAGAHPGVLIRLAPARTIVLVKSPKPKPVRVIRPVRKVWVRGHWKINRFGRRVWVAGHWKRLR